MSIGKQLTQGEITLGFAKLGVNPIERDVRELRELMTGQKKAQETVLYRTVLTNGTGKLQAQRQDREHAELERDAS